MSRVIIRIALIVERSDESMPASAPMMFILDSDEKCETVARALHSRISEVVAPMMESFSKKL